MDLIEKILSFFDVFLCPISLLLFDVWVFNDPVLFYSCATKEHVQLHCELSANFSLVFCTEMAYLRFSYQQRETFHPFLGSAGFYGLKHEPNFSRRQSQAG
jgi:hypothetical protein